MRLRVLVAVLCLVAAPAAAQPSIDKLAWLHANVADWPATSRVTAVTFTSGSLEVKHTKAGQWPVATFDGTQIEGNPWVCAELAGWKCATYEWLRPGQTKKGIHAGNIGAHTKRPPLQTWTPKPGELVGFLVSTPARDSRRTSNERSNIAWVRWGESATFDVTPPPPVDPPPVDPPPVPPDPPTTDAHLEELRKLNDQIAAMRLELAAAVAALQAEIEKGVRVRFQ